MSGLLGLRRNWGKELLREIEIPSIPVSQTSSRYKNVIFEMLILSDFITRKIEAAIIKGKLSKDVFVIADFSLWI